MNHDLSLTCIQHPLKLHFDFIDLRPWTDKKNPYQYSEDSLRFLIPLLFSGLYFQGSLAEDIQTILDCNLSIGEIAQIRVQKSGNGDFAYHLLSASGAWSDSQPLDPSEWGQRKIVFIYPHSRPAYRYEIRIEAGSGWIYRIYRSDSHEPWATGFADCF